MMTATPIFFVLYKPYMPIIFYKKHFFRFLLLNKNLTFALRIGSICLVLSASTDSNFNVMEHFHFFLIGAKNVFDILGVIPKL